MTTVLITGAAGFVGRALVSQFHLAGYVVHGLDRDPGVASVPGCDVPHIIDIRDAAAVQRAVPLNSVVVHAAAAVPIVGTRSDLRQVNIEGSRNVARAASRAGSVFVVDISSSAIYGRPRRAIDPTSRPDPFEPYGRSKLAGEQAFREELHASGTPSAVLRPKTVAGAERGGIFSVLFRWLERGLPIPVADKGSGRWQLVSLSDFARLTEHVATHRLSGVWPAGAPDARTLREEIGGLIDLVHSESNLVDIPASVLEMAAPLARLPGVPFTSWHLRSWARPNFTFDPTWVPPGFRYADSNFDALVAAWESRPPGSSPGSAHRTDLSTRMLDLALAISAPVLRRRRLR